MHKPIAIRDEHGRYLKGMPGGPGRPLGSRNKLREDFFADMHAAWLKRGQEVIDRLIAERPEIRPIDIFGADLLRRPVAVS